MKINETTLGLDCFISVRNKKTKRVEKQQEKRCFFGVPCSDEGKEMIRCAIRLELLAEGKKPEDFLISVE